MLKDSKVIKVQKWTVEVTHFEDGTVQMDRINDGFNPYELIGLSTYMREDIVKQMEKTIIPTVVNRKVIKD